MTSQTGPFPADLSNNPNYPHRTPVRIIYTNWQAQTAVRTIIPGSIYWGSNQWHKEPQYLLTAWDMDKQGIRDFALAGIRAWNV